MSLRFFTQLFSRSADKGVDPGVRTVRMEIDYKGNGVAMSREIKKPVVYYRVSTRDQDTVSQRAEVEKYIISLGLDPKKVPIYCDTGKSGRNIKNRPEFKKMMRHAEAGDFDTIIVYKIDRFSRDSDITIQLVMKLRDMGIGFISSTEPINRHEDPFANTMVAMFADMAQAESKKISERVKAGMAVAKKNGKIFGRPKVLSDETTAKIIHLHFEKGITIRKVSMMVEVGYGTAQKVIADKKESMGKNEILKRIQSST